MNYYIRQAVAEDYDEINNLHKRYLDLNEDNKEIPPLMLVKSDGAVLYDTTELATMYQRVQDFNPDGMWYFTDERQALHFEQSFRGAIKSGLAKPST